MQSQKDDFTLKNYERCLKEAKILNYDFYLLQDWQKADESRSIILRHDVDTQLDVALQMAKIEKENNVKSTYFIRLHSHSYNVLCLKDFDKINQIKKMGHEIGLHYESDFYSIIKQKTITYLKKEIELLEVVFNLKIKSIAPHEPSRTNKFHIDEIDDIVQAYDKQICNKFKYISDSSCRWRDGSFYENLMKKNCENLYVLTHPYWWYNKTPIENY